MADFSDAEDKYLVRLALKHEIAGTQISWTELSKKMKKWKNNKEKLRLRLKCLKTRFGPNICDFPRRYFEDKPRQPRRVSKNIVTTNRSDALRLDTNTAPRPRAIDASEHDDLTNTLALEDSCGGMDSLEASVGSLEHSFGGMNSAVPVRADDSRHTTPLMEPPRSILEEFNATLDAFNSQTSVHDSSCALSSLCVVASLVRGTVEELVVEDLVCYAIIEKMFQFIPRAEVCHKSSHPEQHMGEVSMVGVTALLSALEIQKEDVFMDVGAGIGNVVAQVALQSRAHLVLGIEIRERAVQLAKRVIADTAIHHRQLLKIIMLAGDIRMLEIIFNASVQSSTILYSFNTVFDNATNTAIESLCCELRSLRLVVVAHKFCPRHERRQNCRNKFCTKWKMEEEVNVDVTYSPKPVRFFIYKRQHR
jgi:Histone methylation protein DOT1